MARRKRVYSDGFVKCIGEKYIIYTETSLQFELGKYLQEKIGSEYCVQFERNVKNIFKDNEEAQKLYKSESDIVIFKDSRNGNEPLSELDKEINSIKNS